MSQEVRGACGRVRAGIVGLLVTLSLVACTAQEGDSVPATSGTGSPASTSAATVTPPQAPSETPVPETPVPAASFTPPPKPVAPATLDDPTPEGALSAIRYFYDLYPYAYATGDIEGLKDVSGNACGYCMKLMEKVVKLHGDGGAVSGFAVEILDAEYVEETATPFFVELQVRFRQGQGQVRRTNSSEVEEQAPSDGYLAISVELKDTWEISKVLKVIDE